MQFVWERLEKNNYLAITGIPDPAAQTLIINQLIHPLGEKISAVLCLSKSSQPQKKAALLNEYWQGIWDHGFKLMEFSQNTIEFFNLLLNQKTIFLQAREADLDAMILSKESLNAQAQVIELNKNLNLAELKKILVAQDYSPNTTCAQPYDYSVRGSIIDLWPAGFDHPVRIVLDNKTIEEIFTFNRRGEKITSLNKVCLPSLNQTVNQSKFSSWLDEFDLIFVNDAEEKLIKTIRRQAWSKKIINLTKFSTAGAIDLKGKNLSALTPLQTIWSNLATNKIDKIFSDQNIKELDLKINLLPSFTYLTSWSSPVLGLLVWAPASQNKKNKLTGPEKQRLFLQKIKPGDILVHQDHGLCRFAGLVEQEIDGLASEYLKLNFAARDRIYLPPYQINKASKYIGEPNPKLNRLSGSSWLNTLKKVKEEALNLAFAIIQLQAQRQLVKIPALPETAEEKILHNSFPYELTPDQTKAWEDLKRDLNSDTPMDRLLCGDVAFGKTELALRAAYRAIINGRQVALLAPTTILVQQHYDVFRERLEPLGVKTALLSRWQENREQKIIINDLKNKKIDLVIGTHRLLSADVTIPQLGLLIIDEEQKFGVKDKEKLRRQKPQLHTLTMSATPIPRTLNYSLSGLRDISLIQTPPPGRLPIATAILPWEQNAIKQAIELELARHGQIYYLVRKVKEMPGVLKLLTKLFPTKNIKPAHGQLLAKELAQTMQEFDQGKIDILLCSTIIENGLDLPNANTLIVDNAAHFGLAQLYQLRGRIGRSDRQGYAYLFFHRQKLTGLASKRLAALRAAYELGSGFEIALQDLEIRGAGNLLGKEQHGQIAAIGLNLYTQLVDESIHHLQSDLPAKPKLDVIIDLPLTSTLTTNDVQGDLNRLSIYQQLSFCRNEKEIDREVARIFPTDKSLGVTNFINILKLKLACAQAGIYQVEGQVLSREPFNVKLTLSLIPDHNNKIIKKLLAHNDNWLYDGSHLKIQTKEMLTDNWLEELIANVKLLK